MSAAIKELEQYYTLLGLEVGASLEEINQAYRDLAFIWHPDRVPKDNKRLLEKAAAKLQEINHARDQLRLIKKQSNAYYPNNTPAHSDQSKKKYSHSSYYRPPRPYYTDLRGADLRSANLREKDFSGRDLSLADLSHADLSDSFLHKINLESANLFQANLFRANLLGSNLRYANLQETNLIGADLSGADLTEADLRGAKIACGSRILVKLTGAILTGMILPDGKVHT